MILLRNKKIGFFIIYIIITFITQNVAFVTFYVAFIIFYFTKIIIHVIIFYYK